MKYQRLYDLNIQDFGNLNNVQIGGLTIYAEARGESDQGRIGVGTVILERVDHREWDGKTVQEVCLWPFQFSCYLPGDPNRIVLSDIAKHWDLEIKKNKTLIQCVNIFDGLMNGKIERYPKGAIQYLNPKSVKTIPDWVSKMKFLATIKNHDFYSEA